MAESLDTAEFEAVQEWRRRVGDAVSTVMIGQDELIARLMIGLLCDGHVLLEGVPGLGKSLMVSTLAAALGLRFQRIQFTPDLLPADLTGTQILHPGRGEFVVKKGPLFAEIVLADEINRAPPKVQSALLEAMQERQITLGDQTEALPRPFFVLATQNPIEQEGTYPLPEAELDRFFFKLHLNYPHHDEEREILARHGRIGSPRTVAAVTNAEEILRSRRVLDAIHVDEKVTDYLLRVVEATRPPATTSEAVRSVQYGASPRASLALFRASKGHALWEGRDFVTPRDVKTMALDVLRHRLVLTFEAQAHGETAEPILRQILADVEVP